MENKKKDRSLAKETMDQCSILYCTKDLPMTQTCMCWGWECGSGWFNVLHEASCKLEALNLIYYPKYKVRIQADQVKEKFGTLRFYFSVICEDAERTKEQEVIMTAMNSWADEIVRWAEDECYKTCEECGHQIGENWSPRCETLGWITYICDTCAEKRGTLYIKNGEKWQGKTRLMTQEEVKAEHEEFERKWREKCEAEKDLGADVFEDKDKKDEEN